VLDRFCDTFSPGKNASDRNNLESQIDQIDDCRSASVSASPKLGAESNDVLRRVTRNIGWLVISDGFRLVSMAANVLVARFLGAADFGMLTLARETARCAALPSDLGIATYGQAAAARCREDKLAELADEIVPVRGVIGLGIYALFAVWCMWTFNDSGTHLLFLSSGLFVVSETMRVDWIFRGRERFELVVIARAFETVGFLLIVLLVGSRPHALLFDSAGWSASQLLMATVWLVLLPSAIGRSVRLRIDLRGWFSHAAKAFYVPVAVALVWAGWLMLLWMVAATGSHRDVGILAAAYSLTMNFVNMGIVLIMGFFPASAKLPPDSQLLSNMRRTLTSSTLILGLFIAVVGTVLAAPTVHFLFGPGYQESVRLLQCLIWLAPLRLIRAAYGYTLVSSGFERLFPLGPAVALFVAVVSGVPLITREHALGAATAALAAEFAGAVTTILVSRVCYGDASLPNVAWLLKCAILNVGLYRRINLS
jgi:O-antigen/teichoic acid export membrane protein